MADLYGRAGALRILAAAIGLALGLVSALAAAEEHVTFGCGWLFDNDAIGDGNDRWHTGSVGSLNANFRF